MRRLPDIRATATLATSATLGTNDSSVTTRAPHQAPAPTSRDTDAAAKPGARELSEAGQIELRTVRQLSDIPRESWQSLLAASDNPFVTWHFLEALERTGCVSEERGWWPMHLTAWLDDQLVAAAPGYVKGDGMGDFSRDWAYHDALRQLGGTAYPKLVVGVPFSPVTGPRVLVRADFDYDLGVRLLMDLAREVARASGLGSIQVLYHDEKESRALSQAGMASRVLIQYHWRNHGYSSVDEWLNRLPGRKRKQVRKERLAPEKQGLRIVTSRHADRHEGDLAQSPSQGLHAEPAVPSELRDPLTSARSAHALYRTTCEKYMWGGAYLNRDFFVALFTEPNLSPAVEFVAAYDPARGNEIVAGAINLASTTHLYGRYWGCHEEHNFLHFNVCLYHSIEQCIERGVQVFEGGAGGEHKLSRGFEPTAVHHALWFAQPAVHEPLATALAHDAERQRAALHHWASEHGLARPQEQGTS